MSDDNPQPQPKANRTRVSSTSEGPANPVNILLPPSPQHSQNEFEALVELCATDEPIGPVRNHQPDSEESVDLKDADGQLDFAKIEMFFSDRAKSGSPTSVSRKGTDNANGRAGQTGEAGSRMTSDSPPRTDGRPSQYDTTLDSDIGMFDAGISANAVQSTPLFTTRPLRQASGDLIDLSSDLPLGNPVFKSGKQYHSSGLSPTQGSSNNLNSPLTFSAVKNVLDMAHREVDSLRARCRKLEDMIQKPRLQQRGLEKSKNRDAPLAPVPSGSVRQDHDTETNPEEDTAGFETLPHLQAPDVNHLSLSQTRFALQSLLNELGLPMSCLRQLLHDNGSKERVTPSLSLDEIRRAIDLTSFLDELVWKRSRLGAAYDNPYSTENIEALRARLELWERAVRTRK